MDKFLKTLVIVGIVLLGFTFGCIYSVSVATEITQTNPTNPKASIDCLLIQYSDNGQDGLRISSYWLKDKGCKRTVVYPEGYVPVLISPNLE